VTINDHGMSFHCALQAPLGRPVGGYWVSGRAPGQVASRKWCGQAPIELGRACPLWQMQTGGCNLPREQYAKG
jgi:hypothetical protein